jgi:phage gp46-like protein
MAQYIAMNPQTRDYVIVNGSPVESTSVDDPVYFALLIPQGKWLYGTPTQGSLLYTLDGQKNYSKTSQSYAAYAQKAIKTQIIDTGIGSAQQVTNLQSTATGTVNQIGVVPSSQQVSGTLNFTAV